LETVNVAWNILKVALGLGFVIFIHELGHFLLAKWNGVKVEKFSIGFGPTLASFRRGVGLRIGQGSRPPGPGDPPTYGETEYILAALPLGGYVKMLGESTEDTPEGVEKSTDPRAYNNKPVFGRMGIITAGVIMNVILGIACFALVHGQGIEAQPARVGGVLPGSPAYKAGLRAGDEIVAIDGRRDVIYNQLIQRVSLSKEGEKVQFTIRRPGSDKESTLPIEPRREPGSPGPRIGLHSASSLKLFSEIPFRALPGQDDNKRGPLGGFTKGDVVVAIGPEGGPLAPVVDHDDLDRKLDALRDRPIVVEVQREGPEEDGRPGPTSRDRVTLPPHRFVEFGFRLAPGAVEAIRPDSPAEKAGLKPGDRIVARDGNKDYDPIRLPDYCRDHAGKPITLTVERTGEASGKATTLDLSATPDDSPPWVEPIAQFAGVESFDIPGLGLAMVVEPKIVAVQEGSPAAKAGLKPGDAIRSITITPAKFDKSKPKPETIALDKKAPSWPYAFAIIQEVPWTSIELTTDRSDRPVAIRPELDPDRYHPLRGLNFQALTRKIPPAGLLDSLKRGSEEAWENADGIFKVLGSLFQGRMGADALGGMIPIAQVAYNRASSGFLPFVHFLGILSINLAVLNFLPIPPLDGGQFVFLAAEKVRGRPLPDAALNVMQIAGIVFVLGLILFVNVKDIVLLVKSYL